VNLKRRDVRVHILGPGAIDTDILEGMPREKLDSFVVLLPRGRRGRPEEFASAALLSRRATPPSSPASSCSLMAASQRDESAGPGLPFTCFPRPAAYSQSIAFERRIAGRPVDPVAHSMIAEAAECLGAFLTRR
jgi:hypothetical protein